MNADWCLAALSRRFRRLLTDPATRDRVRMEQELRASLRGVENSPIAADVTTAEQLSEEIDTWADYMDAHPMHLSASVPALDLPQTVEELFAHFDIKPAVGAFC